MIKKNTRLYLKFLLSLCLVVVMSSVIFLSLVPPTGRDELIHHLAIPKLYLEHGGIYEIPFMEYSYYPMNLDLLYMIPLYFGNDIVPKFIHFTFALLTAWLIFRYLKRRTDPLYALSGALFFLSIPVIIKLSITAYVDLGEIFFTFGGLILVLEWLESGFRIKYLFIAALMCGLALGTKYNGLITLTILTFFVPFIYSRYNGDGSPGFARPTGFAIVFFLVSLLIFSPWMLKNYHWKNNPVYPLYNQVFNPAQSAKNSLSIQDGTEKENQGFFTYRSLVYKETGGQIALLPVRIFFQGKDNEPQYFDGKLNPFLLILPFFAFYRLKDEPEYLRREKKILLVFSLLFFSFGFFATVLRIRYISPFIPPLIVLSVFGFINLFKMVRQVSMELIRKACITLVILIPCSALALNADYLISQFKSVNPVPLITGSMSRDEYIEKYIPEYPAVKYINKNLDARAKLLFIYMGQRGYYCDRDYIFDSDMEILKKPIINAAGHEDILMALKSQGVTHLLINYLLFNRWVNDNFSVEKQALLKEFFGTDLSLLYVKNGFGVLALK